MWLSNSAELISRLFVIAMNTPIEVDIYGHVNSTHVDGSRVINGLGGSGDFFRNAYLSIVHTPSVRKLKDGRTVSCVMPYVRHIDHTEHDIKCVVTEQGYAINTEIRSARRPRRGHHRAAAPTRTSGRCCTSTSSARARAITSRASPAPMTS